MIEAKTLIAVHHPPERLVYLRAVHRKRMGIWWRAGAGQGWKGPYQYSSNARRKYYAADINCYKVVAALHQQTEAVFEVAIHLTERVNLRLIQCLMLSCQKYCPMSAKPMLKVARRTSSCKIKPVRTGSHSGLAQLAVYAFDCKNES